MSYDKFKLLCWKNFKLQARHKFAAFVEFLMPNTIIFFLISLSYGISNGSYDDHSRESKSDTEERFSRFGAGFTMLLVLSLLYSVLLIIKVSFKSFFSVLSSLKFFLTEFSNRTCKPNERIYENDGLIVDTSLACLVHKVLRYAANFHHRIDNSHEQFFGIQSTSFWPHKHISLLDFSHDLRKFHNHILLSRQRDN
jgi:hypothetical protein